MREPEHVSEFKLFVRVQVQIRPAGEEPVWTYYVRENAAFAIVPGVGDLLIIEAVEPPVADLVGEGIVRLGIPSRPMVGAFAVEVIERRISRSAVYLDTGVYYDDSHEDPESLVWGEIIALLENAGYSRWDGDDD